jgi:hypothetical protein
MISSAALELGAQTGVVAALLQKIEATPTVLPDYFCRAAIPICISG